MINLKKITFPKSTFPLIKIDNFISSKLCNNLKEVIENQNNFDDFVMNGRNRINKGSNTFREFLSSSKNANKIYNSLNSRATFIKILKIFEDNFQNSFWKFKQKKLQFSKTNYGLQKGSKLTKNFSKSKNVF